MPFCQSCGKEVNAHARFCNACGKPANLTYASSPSVAAASGAVALPIETQPAAPSMELAVAPASAPVGVRVSERSGRARRPRGVTILAVLSFLALIPTLVLGVVLQSYAASASAAGDIPAMQWLMRILPVLSQGNRDMVTQASAGALVLFIMAAFFAVMAYGLWTLRKWARILAIVCGGLGALRAAVIIFVAPGTLIWQLIVIGINVWIITYLLKPHVKQAFGTRVS